MMRLRIEIKTPKGYATSTSKKIQPYIIGSRKIQKHEIYASPADDRIIWIVDAEIKDALAIQRNLSIFDKVIGLILKSKPVQKLARLSEEGKAELDDLLRNQTKIRVIKHYDQMPDLKDWNKEI